MTESDRLGSLLSRNWLREKLRDISWDADMRAQVFRGYCVSVYRDEDARRGQSRGECRGEKVLLASPSGRMDTTLPRLQPAMRGT